jgi:hypothetical protein
VKDIAVDFGQLIAYAIPGAFALFAVAAVVPDLQFALAAPDSHRWLAQALLGAGLSVALGMLISVLRMGVIDSTFSAVALPGHGPKRPHRERFERVEPDYAIMVNKDVLAALSDAKASDKRPYQFYGNMLLSLYALELARAYTTGLGLAELAIFVVAAVSFYLAARRSSYRYMTAVAALNQVKQHRA